MYEFLESLTSQARQRVTEISDHHHEPTILRNTLFESMPTQIMHYATTKNMLSNTIGIMDMIKS
jgi:hypothetical protein